MSHTESTKSRWVAALDLWWTEATGPLNIAQHGYLGRAVWHRMLWWAPPVIIILLTLCAGAAYFLIVWRAHDFAEKALASASAGDLRSARLQVFSARNLLAGDPSVLRAAAMVESKAGNPDALGLWRELEAKSPLSAEEQLQRAEIAVQFGTETEFASALAGLESTGDPGAVHRVRGERAMRRMDLDGAIAEMRLARVPDDSPALRLTLAGLLLRRHAYLFASETAGEEDREAAGEFGQLILSLQDTEEAAAALALALGPAARLMTDSVQRDAWAREALRDLRADNPALLGAASVLRSNGAYTTPQLFGLLRPVFAEAPLASRAAFAQWIALEGLPQHAHEMVGRDEALRDPAAFAAVAQAFVVAENWGALGSLAQEAGEMVPAWLRALTEARAASKLGNRGTLERALKTAMAQAVPRGVLPQILNEADSLGEQALVDSQLVELCAQPDSDAKAFRVALVRFAGEARSGTLAAAFRAARSASPAAPPVVAYGRYLRLLKGEQVDPAETAAACEVAARDAQIRLTHALALLKSGRPAEALSSLDDITLFLQQMPPGARVVVAALYAANGQPAFSRAALRNMEPQDLTADEKRLFQSVLDSLPPS